MKRVLFLLAVSCWAIATQARVLVNEAMVNEPHNFVTLEWIEIYNDSSDYVELNTMTLDVNGTSISLFNYGFLAPHSYMIFCRNLVATSGSPGFESQWGDSSGLWGDTPEEAALRVAEEDFALSNASGYIRLYSISTLLSELTWIDLGGDGYSWERTTAASTAGVNSIDPTGCTPGRLNSVSPVRLDLEIDSIWNASATGSSALRIEIFNRGTDSAKTQSLLLYRRQAADSMDSQDTIEVIPIDPLRPNGRDTLLFESAETGFYTPVGLRLSTDDRVANNSAFTRVTGGDYPPVILTEFLPDPESPLEVEWVELQNVSDSTINLAGWRLGNQLQVRGFTGSLELLFPGERIIVTQDSTAFREYYPDAPTRVFQPGSWPSLVNGGDQVRLLDTFGFVADSHLYAAGYADNFTIARDQREQPDGSWLKSATAGGTPGQVNTVWLQPTADRTTLVADPQVFSPDGDGYQDETTLRLTVVDASAYTLKIYDRTGNLVKTFLDAEPLNTGAVIWDGRSDAGTRLPIGLYICYFEAEGVESVKETVVIAR